MSSESTLLTPLGRSDNFLEALERAARGGSAQDAYQSPGELAAVLDTMTVQTDALDVIDKALVGVDEAVGVMMRRRMLIARLRRSGMGDVEAPARAPLEIHRKV